MVSPFSNGNVRRKATTSKRTLTALEIEAKKQSILHSITGMIRLHEIPDEPVMNLLEQTDELQPIDLSVVKVLSGCTDEF